MTTKPTHFMGEGPFRASDVPLDGYYELSEGHPIQLQPSGMRHGEKNTTGALVIATDPAVSEIGTDIGHKLGEKTLRAPDLSVGNLSNTEHFAEGAPKLAVEYADVGTDENDLQKKISQFFAAGTLFVWVVRLVGPQRVEVYEANKTPRTYSGTDEITAPGIIKNPIPAAALYDRKTALETSLRNLLERAGYRSLEEVRDEGYSEGEEHGIERGIERGIEKGVLIGREQGKQEGREEGREEGLLEGQKEALFTILRARGCSPDDVLTARIRHCTTASVLSTWIAQAASSSDPLSIFAS